MYKCKRCGGQCDPGELRGGTCDECREEERVLEIRREWNQKMLAKNVIEQLDGQLVLNYAGRV